MTTIERKIYNDIIKMIKDNLEILIRNNNHYLNYFKDYCRHTKIKDLPLDQSQLTMLTMDVLTALLNADFLYDFREL